MVKGILQTKKQIQVGHLEVTRFLHIFQTRIKPLQQINGSDKIPDLHLKREGFTVQLKEINNQTLHFSTKALSPWLLLQQMQQQFLRAVFWLCCRDGRRLEMHSGIPGQGAPISVISHYTHRTPRGGV